MSAVKPLPSLRERQAATLLPFDEDDDEGVDVTEFPDDLVAIGDERLLVAWLLKDGLRDEGDSHS